MSDEENKPADTQPTDPKKGIGWSDRKAVETTGDEAAETAAKLQPKQTEALNAKPTKREPERNERFEKWQKIQNAAARLAATVHDPKQFDAALIAVQNAAK